MSRKPNVLYIMADQFHAECLGIAGSQARTPNLDLIAGEGVRFSRAYCNNPVCGPSRAAFITGQYPHTNGILGNNIHDLSDRNEHTLGAVFRREGYQTGLVGKSHMVGEWDREAFEYVRYSDLTDCDRLDPMDNHYFRYLHEQGLADLYELGNLPAKHPGHSMRAFDSPIPEAHSLERWTGDMALEFLRRRDPERPFLLHLSFQRPHPPLTVPYDRGLLYDPASIKLPPGAEEAIAQQDKLRPAGMREVADRVHGFPYMPEHADDLRRQLAYYYSLITIIDEQIGRVAEMLKEEGAYDNTVIVFVADHGDFAGHRGLMLKNLGIYEPIHRIPFILKAPGVTGGVVSEAMIESVDLFPTLCELSGVPIPQPVEGSSVVPIVRDGKPGKEQVVCEWDFVNYDNRVLAVRTANHRLVYYGREYGGELFDCQADPDELTNVYDHPAYADIRFELLQRLTDHVSRFAVKSTFRKDKMLGYRTRNSMTSMLHKGGRSWSELQGLYKQ
jgi:uncharacterized sulfatase